MAKKMTVIPRSSKTRPGEVVMDSWRMVLVTVIGEDNSRGLSRLRTSVWSRTVCRKPSSLRATLEAGWLVATPEELMNAV